MKEKFLIVLAITFTLPWLCLYTFNAHLPPYLTALISGLAVISSAFLISWSAETAELDVPRSISLAVVALLAVLPEYAVDMYFAWMAGRVGEEYVHYATANMTGANRLLIGIGWSLVTIIAMIKMRRKDVELDEGIRFETLILLMATLYSFTIPLKSSIHPLDCIVLITLYIFYIYLATKGYREEFLLDGVPKYLASFPKKLRRTTVISLIIYSGMVIFVSVEAFAEGLISTARLFGFDEFLMVQWIAPLASESPEFVIALYLVRRLRVTAGMNALISSKVNQWTLLIGALPIVYSMALQTLSPLPLDARQREEIFLTASQSLFGLAVISNLRISMWEALALLTLFLAQFVYESVETRYVLSFIYIFLSIPILIKERENLIKSVKYIMSF